MGMSASKQIKFRDAEAKLKEKVNSNKERRRIERAADRDTT